MRANLDIFHFAEDHTPWLAACGGFFAFRSRLLGWQRPTYVQFYIGISTYLMTGKDTFCQGDSRVQACGVFRDTKCSLTQAYVLYGEPGFASSSY